METSYALTRLKGRHRGSVPDSFFIGVSSTLITETGKIPPERSFCRAATALSESIIPEVVFPFTSRALYSNTGILSIISFDGKVKSAYTAYQKNIKNQVETPKILTVKKFG